MCQNVLNVINWFMISLSVERGYLSINTLNKYISLKIYRNPLSSFFLHIYSRREIKLVLGALNTLYLYILKSHSSMSNSFNYYCPIFRELQALEIGLIRIEIQSDYNPPILYTTKLYVYTKGRITSQYVECNRTYSPFPICHHKTHNQTPTPHPTLHPTPPKKKRERHHVQLSVSMLVTNSIIDVNWKGVNQIRQPKKKPFA